MSKHFVLDVVSNWLLGKECLARDANGRCVAEKSAGKKGPITHSENVQQSRQLVADRGTCAKREVVLLTKLVS